MNHFRLITKWDSNQELCKTNAIVIQVIKVCQIIELFKRSEPTYIHNASIISYLTFVASTAQILALANYYIEHLFTVRKRGRNGRFQQKLCFILKKFRHEVNSKIVSVFYMFFMSRIGWCSDILSNDAKLYLLKEENIDDISKWVKPN